MPEKTQVLIARSRQFDDRMRHKCSLQRWQSYSASHRGSEPWRSFPLPLRVGDCDRTMFPYNNYHSCAAPAQIGMKTENTKFPVFSHNVFERGSLQSTAPATALLGMVLLLRFLALLLARYHPFHWKEPLHCLERFGLSF